MKKRLILLLGAIVFLSGCTMIPRYERPASPAPPAWPEGPVYGDAAGAPEAPLPGDLNWREFFTDPDLQAVIETALANNRDLRTAALNVEKARAMYRIQRSELLPTITGSAAGGRQVIPASTFGAGDGSITIDHYEVTAGIPSWELDFFGRIRSLKQSALEAYFATEEARRAARILLVSETATAWLTLTADRENLSLARSTLASQQAAYDLINRRVEVGLTSELDLYQTAALVEAARADVARFAAQVARDENALNFLAGAVVSADRCPETLDAMAPMPALFAGASSDILLNRPDIQQAEHRLKAAEANIGAARAVLFPRIALTTTYGTASSDLSGLFESGSRTWAFTPQVALPIFDPRLWSALTVSKVEREIAVTQYERAIQAAFRDVADTLADKGGLKHQLTAQQSLVEATAEAYRLSNARYEKGSDIYLNVLDAQRALYASQQGLIAVRRADIANQIRLYAVLGGGAD